MTPVRDRLIIPERDHLTGCRPGRPMVFRPVRLIRPRRRRARWDETGCRFRFVAGKPGGADAPLGETLSGTA